MLTLLKVTNFKPKISSLIFTKINWPYHCSRALKNPCWRDNIMCNKINVYTHCSFVSKINPQHLWTFDFFGWSLSFLTKLYKNHWLVCPKFRLSQLLDTAFPSYGTRSCLVVGHILDKKQKIDLNRGNSRSVDASRVLSTVVTLIFLGRWKNVLVTSAYLLPYKCSSVLDLFTQTVLLKFLEPNISRQILPDFKYIFQVISIVSLSVNMSSSVSRITIITTVLLLIDLAFFENEWSHY